MAIFLGVFSAASPSHACKCAKYSSPDELFRKSDFVFFGTQTGSSQAEVNFLIHRLAKGDESHIGSSKIGIQWAGDENVMCRGYRLAGDYLVFFCETKKRDI